MNTRSAKRKESRQHVEMLQCEQCRKKWQACWLESGDGQSVEHPLTCDCGQVLKVVHAAVDEAPLMILQHPYWKTILACVPSFVAGVLFPILAEPVILTAYIVSWIACGAIFVNEDNRDFSALAGIVIWSIVLVTGAAAAGALVGHAAWWWWQ